MDKEKIIVSACLLGLSCKYNGGHNLNQRVIKYIKGKEVIPVCPEVFGGLTVPRIPSEIKNDQKIISKLGIDVTDNFNLGMKKTLELAVKNNCKKAILKDGSPSCGYKTIYDGTFTDNKITGIGITASNLLKIGIDIIDLDT